MHRPVAWVAALALLGLSNACGSTNDGSGTSAASPGRTASPSAMPVQPVPDATQLTASNCSGSAPTITPRPLGRYFTIRPASAWTEAPAPQHTETLLLELAAPNTYGFEPTLIQFHTLLRPPPTAHGHTPPAHS